ncbi:MAG: peptidylprolyl isomerase [Nanoarchaeota archaeon]|nr:peptidylprolyl isomerase [Nanoarchaeota archaeon]
MELKKGDFIELNYTGRIKELNKVFDSTEEKTAKQEGIHQEGAKYRPLIICIGEGDVVKGLDESLEGKEAGKNYTIEVTPEKGFGKKDAKLMKIVNTNMFLKNNIQPVPGLQVNIDNMIGTIRTVTGGRTILDFNHPLAGKNLVYEISITRKITDNEEKIRGMLTSYLAIDSPDVKIENETAKVNNEIPEILKKQLEEKIKRTIPEIKKVEYKPKEEKPKEKKKERTDSKNDTVA